MSMAGVIWNRIERHAAIAWADRDACMVHWLGCEVFLWLRDGACTRGIPSYDRSSLGRTLSRGLAHFSTMHACAATTLPPAAKQHQAQSKYHTRVGGGSVVQCWAHLISPAEFDRRVRLLGVGRSVAQVMIPASLASASDATGGAHQTDKPHTNSHHTTIIKQEHPPWRTPRRRASPTCSSPSGACVCVAWVGSIHRSIDR